MTLFGTVTVGHAINWAWLTEERYYERSLLTRYGSSFQVLHIVHVLLALFSLYLSLVATILWSTDNREG
jgi:hypothetical protein